MRVEERLRSAELLLNDVDPAVALAAVRSRHEARRRRKLGGVGAVVAVLLVGGIGVLMTAGDDPSTHLATEAQPSEPTSPGGGQWSEMSKSPLSPRTEAASVTFGSKLFIWGGGYPDEYADGAVYDILTDTWTMLPASPLPAQRGAAAAWTGDEVILWGKWDGTASAAAWNPESNKWRVIPDSEYFGVDRSTGAVVWTGSELVLLGIEPAPGIGMVSDAMAVEVESGVTRSFDSVPTPGEPGFVPRERSAFVTGNQVVLVTAADGFPVTIDRLDLETGEWMETLQTDLSGLDVSARAAAWTGTALVIINHVGPGAVFTPENGQLRSIPPSRSTSRFPPVVVTPEIISVGDRYLDLATDRWMASDPGKGPTRENPETFGNDGSMYVWGGDACGPSAICTAIVDPGPGLIWRPPTGR